MTGPTPPSAPPEDDLERTAELPLLDAGAYEATAVLVRAHPEGARPRSTGRSDTLDLLEEAQRARTQADARAEDLARELKEQQRLAQSLREELAAHEASPADPVAEQLAQAEGRIQQLVADAGAHSAAMALRDSELTRARAAESALTTRVAELTAQAEAQETALGEALRRAEALAVELARLRGELQDAAAGAGAAALASIQELTAQLRAAQESLRTRDSDLSHAQEQLAQAQHSDVTLRAQLAEKEAEFQNLREELLALKTAAAAKADPTIRVPTASMPAPAAAPPGEPSEPPAFPGATRLLIRTDADAETAYVLSQARTRIGRSADNDVQVDVTSISRHHAVILAQAGETLIEDLRSTNGVRVNGRRVTRQTLKDGDTVVIGKAQFRFVVRAPVEVD